MEVIVFGGGEIYRDVFNAMALMTGTNGLSSLLRLAFVLGVVISMLTMMMTLNAGYIMKWFLVATMTYGILWVPKVQIHVTDRTNPTLAGADIANVPWGVGVVASLTTTVGARVIDLAETAFSEPSDARYSANGMVFGAKLYENLQDADFHDAVFDTNMQEFIKACVFYDLLSGHFTTQELQYADDLWAYVTVTKPTNPARSATWTANDGTTSVVSCPDMVTNLNVGWNAALTDSMSVFGKRLNPNVPDPQAATKLAAQLGNLNLAMMGVSQSASETFRQALMIKAMKRGVTSFSADAGATSVDLWAETQAELQTKKSQKTIAAMAEKAIPILKIVVEVLFIGMFPVLFPAFLMPKLGPQMVQGYFGGFVFLQVWGPMYVILHKVMMSAAATKSVAAAYMPGAATGLRLGNMDAISSVNADIALAAGAMTMMIPFLAGALTKGAMTISGHSEAMLGQFKGGAEAGAHMATTGNISMANTAYENHSWNNRSANRHVTDEHREDAGNRTYTTAFGDRVTETSAGGLIAQSGMSSTGYKFNATHAQSAAYTEAAGIASERGQAIRNSATQGFSRAHAEAAQVIDSVTTGTTDTASWGESQNNAWKEGKSQVQQVSEQLHQKYGFEKSSVGNIMVQAAGELGLSAGGPGGKGGYAKASLGGSASRTWSTAERDAIDFAKQQMASTGFTTSVERVGSKYAQDSFANTAASQHMTSQQVSDTFSTQTGATQSADQYESQAASYARRADEAKTSSAAMQVAYDNLWTPYAIDRLQQMRDGYGQVIDRDRAVAMLSSRSQADIDIVDDVAKGFHKKMAADEIVRPGMLDELQGTGSVAGGLRLGPLQAPTGASSAPQADMGARGVQAALRANTPTSLGAGPGAPSSESAVHDRPRKHVAHARSLSDVGSDQDASTDGVAGVSADVGSSGAETPRGPRHDSASTGVGPQATGSGGMQVAPASVDYGPHTRVSSMGSPGEITSATVASSAANGLEHGESSDRAPALAKVDPGSPTLGGSPAERQHAAMPLDDRQSIHPVGADEPNGNGQSGTSLRADSGRVDPGQPAAQAARPKGLSETSADQTIQAQSAVEAPPRRAGTRGSRRTEALNLDGEGQVASQPPTARRPQTARREEGSAAAPSNESQRRAAPTPGSQSGRTAAERHVVTQAPDSGFDIGEMPASMRQRSKLELPRNVSDDQSHDAIYDRLQRGRELLGARGDIMNDAQQKAGLERSTLRKAPLVIGH